MDLPGLAIKRAEHALMAAKGSALAPYGLTVTEYASLRVLMDDPGTSAAEVARQCLVTPQAISFVFVNLEEGGLIERRPHPLHGAAREVLLTDAGRALMEHADRAVMAVEARLVKGLSHREVDVLQRALRHCTENLAPHRKRVRTSQLKSVASSIPASMSSAESLSHR
ncbi:MAG: MarR family transcriptional regulator [Actinomycetota bacterium]|nr:MarR family transcriptional regulator [Actinomycetota bacterium]